MILIFFWAIALLQANSAMANLSSSEQGLLYMFERPYEHLVMPRTNVRYNMPTQDMPEGVVRTRLGGAGLPSIQVQHMDMTLPASVRRIPTGVSFSNFLRSHREAANDLITLLMRANNADDLMQMAANVKRQCNESLFVYCLSFVLIWKPEMRRIRVPAISEVFPSRFIPHTTLVNARNEANMDRFRARPADQIVIDHGLDFSGTDLNMEHRVAYWREDYGLNSHHWHWHLIWPSELPVAGLRDRKGELFYYMHQQMLARYDMERLCNGLNRVRPFHELRQPIPEGYFSKLTVNNAAQNYGTRQDNTFLRDYQRTDQVGLDPFTIQDVDTWRQRIVSSIHRGFLVDSNGRNVPLSDNVDILNEQKRGIDYLGDVVEADARISVNFRFYGDFHNLGHILFAFAHDPDGSHNESHGVMGASETAMRDPIFYRWHRFVDNIFQEYKVAQTPYTPEELDVPGVTITRLGIASGNEGNILRTFYDMRSIEASRGLDFGADSPPVMINLTKLNHSPFTYHILISNTNRLTKRVTIRIFMAPLLNEAGTRMRFMQQQGLWTELDKFVYTLQSGTNHIRRESTQSSITIPEELTFRNIEEIGPQDQGGAYCGCGFPHHLLIPKGRPEGMDFQLFVMASDYEQDQVPTSGSSDSTCTNAISFCGILNERFPDRRPMGYPLDRRPLPPTITNPNAPSEIDSIDSFVRQYSNMNLLNFKIQFTNSLRPSVVDTSPIRFTG